MADQNPEQQVEANDDFGFIMIGETQIPIVDVHLRHGRVTLIASAPSPFPGCRGEATVYGQDLQAILHMPGDVWVRPMLEPGHTLMFSLVLAVDQVVLGEL
jgi:hypothetical protein